MTKNDRMYSFTKHLANRRLILESKVPQGYASKIFDLTIGDIISGLDVDVVIVDTYSASKSCELTYHNGDPYLVFDHALMEYFHLLNIIVSMDINQDFTIAMLYRSLCEACRDASLLREYAFFAIRSNETNHFVRRLLTSSILTSTYWQSIVVLGHEAAHALPPTHNLTKELDSLATLHISLETTSIVSQINKELMTFLDNQDSEYPIGEKGKVADWLNILEAVGDNHESISEVFIEKVDDPRFRAEIKCDLFAIQCIEYYILNRTTKNNIPAFDNYLIDALLSAYRTFLNMRFHEYIKGIASLKDRIGVGNLNLLKLDKLADFIIRGNLFAKEILRSFENLSRQVKLESDVEEFRKSVFQSNSDHTNRLFVPLNNLLEETLLNSEFGTERDKQLTESGYDSSAFDSEPWSVLKKVDALWKIIVR